MNTSLSVRPHAVCTPIVLFAVTGPSKKLNLGPCAFCSRSRSNTRPRCQNSRISCSRAESSGTEGSRVKGCAMAAMVRSGRGILGWAQTAGCCEAMRAAGIRSDSKRVSSVAPNPPAPITM